MAELIPTFRIKLLDDAGQLVMGVRYDNFVVLGPGVTNPDALAGFKELVKMVTDHAPLEIRR